MADTMKFGPQWLRALSDGGGGGSSSSGMSSGGAKYKLAEHRYGREEMLALLCYSKETPSEILEIPPIAVEKSQKPLALIPLSEEEQRLMSQSVNSTVVLRMMGGRSSGAPPALGARGRGGASDRGRGRGRGRGDGYYPRGPYEDDGFGRGRHTREGWEDGHEPHGFEQGSTGFGGSRGRGTFDDTSPGKGYFRSMSTDNWRESRKEATEEDDAGDWRRAGPSRERGWGSNRNWREPRSAGFDQEPGEQQQQRRGFEDYHRNSGFDRERPTFRRSRSSGSYDDDYEGGSLPEWSTADTNDMDELGTFDSSGAFMSIKQKGQAPIKEGGGGEDGHEFWDDAGNEKQQQERDGDMQPEKKEAERAPSTEKQEAGRSPPGTQRKKSPPSSSKKPSESPAEALCGSGDGEAVVASQTVASKVPDVAPVAHSTDIVEKASAPTRREEEADFGHLERAAEDLVANLASEEEERAAAPQPLPLPSASNVLSKDHEDAKKWFYRDPQGDLQGPFTSSEMAEWFSAGYFTMNLLVKRGCDEVFQALGDLIKTWGSLPFLASSSPPPPAVVPQEKPAAVPVAAAARLPSPLLAAAVPAAPMDGSNELQLKAFLHQQALAAQHMQQQALMLQLQQVMSQLQQQEAFSKLNPQQQQQLAMQLLMRQAAVPPAAMGMNKPPELSMPPQGPQQKVSPRTQEEMAAFAARVGMQWPPGQGPAAPPQQQPQPQPPQQQPQPPQMPQPPPSASQGAWAKPTSVWDIENNAKTSPTMEENNQKQQLDRARKEALAQKEEEEARKRREREEIERQREMERQRENERQQEMERQRALERQRELERRQELERQRLEKLRQETEEARQRQQIEDERRRAAEKRRQEEALRIQQEEEEKRRRQFEVEQKKQDEFRRRQEKADELKRQQQQETVRRLQQEQLSNIQLPAHAQWGNSAPSSQQSALSLSEIQELEAQREEQEREQQVELQRAQMSALKQQQQQTRQQQQQRSWASHATTQNSGPSLLDIQQEEAEKEKQKTGSSAPVAAKAAPEMPLSQAAVWGSGGPNPSATWATEGTWGNSKTAAGGFWDEPVVPQQSSKKKGNSHVNNSHFPALNNPSPASSQTTQSSGKSKASRTKKEEEAVQRLFQSMKPQDDFTRWCESALKGLQTSVDVPTFIAFLKDVDSPYEVNDYVRSYLGDSPAAAQFSKEFIEKRSRHKNQQKHQEPEESMWGPAPAVNPNKGIKSSTLNNNGMSSNHNMKEKEVESEEARNKRRKKKMQKLDASSILGFTVQADPDRVNIGEIDTGLN